MDEMSQHSASALAAATVLVLAAVISSASGGNKNKPPSKPPEPAKPAVHLAATPKHGFRPLSVTLTGTLTGVDDNDAMYCHAGVEWESHTPQALTTISKEDPRCLHPPEEVRVQTTFTKIV